MTDTHGSHQTVSRGVVVPALPSAGMEPRKDAKQTAAASQTSTLLSTRSDRWMAQPRGQLRDLSCRELPEETTTTAGRLQCVSKRSRGERFRGGSSSAGGAVGEDDEVGPEDGGGLDHWRETGGRLEVGCRREASSRNDTGTARVDEEEMVVKAIKIFRLLSHAAKPAGESHSHGPRCRAAPEGATPWSSESRTATSAYEGTSTAGENNATATQGTKGGANRPLSSRGCGREGENATPRPSAGHDHGRAEGVQSLSSETATASNDNGFCEGNDWLLKVNSPVVFRCVIFHVSESDRCCGVLKRKNKRVRAACAVKADIKARCWRYPKSIATSHVATVLVSC